MPAEKPNRRVVKAGLDKDDCRRARNDQKVELRKAKKDEGLQKRRNLSAFEGAEDGELPCSSPAQPTPTAIESLGKTVLAFIANNGPAEDLDVTLAAVKELRKLLSIPNNPPLDDVIGANLVGPLVMLLQYPMAEIQFEAAWCLTNVASGNSAQCEHVLSHNAVQALVPLITSESLDVCEQAAWAIGNIAGDCAKYRDLVLGAGAMPQILKMIEHCATAGKMVPLRNSTWALSNLCRGKPQPKRAAVEAAIPVLARLLHIEDAELKQDACWALSYLSDGCNELIDAVAKSGVVPLLMGVLRGGDLKTKTPALRALSNMLTGSDEATQCVLDAGFLAALPDVMRSKKVQMRKEACWALSNVTAGTPAQLDAAVMCAGLMAMVVERLEQDEFEVKKEAAWCVANVMHGFKYEATVHAAQRVASVVQLGVVPPMVKLLHANDAAVAKLMLDAVGNMLAAGDKLAVGEGGKGCGANPFVALFDEAEGIDKLEALQEHDNEEVYAKAVEILEAHFAEDDAEDENLLPNTASNGAGFAFGAPQQNAMPQFAF